MKKIIVLVALLTAGLALSGCFRKSIESSPPAKRPAVRADTGSTETPEIISETYSVDAEQRPVIEETYPVGNEGPEIIDESYDVQPAAGDDGPVRVKAVAEEIDHPDIGGSDLAEEPAPEIAAETVTPAPAEKPETAEVDPKAREAFEPIPDPEDENVMAMEDAHGPEAAAPAATTMPEIAETGPYFVQVGAFSDLENANKVLAGLLSDGYKGSMLQKTDNDMYRVHAGAFADKANAEAALEKLRPGFPNGFVIKID